MKTEIAAQRGKLRPAQAEMPIDGGFRLITETVPDWQQIAAEEQREAARAEEAAKAQLSLF